jgi:hypothetical protein
MERQEPEIQPTTEEEEVPRVHPTKPAEGAREPGEDADDPLPPHPDEPAEGER